MSEERNDDLLEVNPPVHEIPVQVLFVVVPPSVKTECSDPEEIAQRLQRINAFGALDHSECVSHLISGLVALPSSVPRLANQVDGETSLAVDEPDHPSDLDQPFLLVFCTARIVTHTSIVELTCEYRQILNRFPSIWPNVYRAVAGTGGSFDSTLGPL